MVGFRGVYLGGDLRSPGNCLHTDGSWAVRNSQEENEDFVIELLVHLITFCSTTMQLRYLH